MTNDRTHAHYGEIEVGLHRSYPDAYGVELRVTDPGTAGEVAPARGQSRISLEALSALQHSAADYGRVLSDQLFQDPEIREFYLKNRAALDSRGLMLRLRILIGPSAPELHSVRWELLCDPETKLPLATSERILFSRFMLSRDWRTVTPIPKEKWKALVAVAAPSDATDFGLAEVDAAGEVDRACRGLAGIEVNVLGRDQPLTLDALIDGIRQGMNIVYLVCHGVIPKGRAPHLFLQTTEGKTAPVSVSDLAHRIGEIQESPSLMVLASCESAGRVERSVSGNDGSAAHSALAPRLAEAGVPAVVAMQGKITMETVRLAMPVFFRELVRDGQIDRAMAVARGVVRDRSDSWMPALFLRLKSGCLWNGPDLEGKGRTTVPPHGSSGTFNPAILASLEKSLVQWIGPIAGAVVRKQSLTAGNLAEMCRALSEQIPSASERALFLKACGREFGTEAIRESQHTARAPVAAPGSVPGQRIEFDRAFLDRAKKQLAGYIGPIAKVAVERAAKQADSLEQFMTLLTAEIPSAPDRERFRASMRN